MVEKEKKRTRPTYCDDFKADAVRLVEEENLPVARVARDLGVHKNTLRNWVDAARFESTGGSMPAGEDDRAELVKLRRENRILREEREILKKAAAFFAKESR
ncbi:MAG: transposase [Bradymonadaceae bacterium]